MRLKLSGQAIDVLLVLTANPGRLVTRQELQQQLWPGVDYGDFEHGLNAAVSRLREALGDSAKDPEYIETIPQRGYRFIAVPPVEEVGPEEGPTAVGPEAATVSEVTRRKVSTRAIRLAVAAALAVAAVAAVFLLLRPAAEDARQWTITPVTTYPGEQFAPRLSPDGQSIAFFWSGPLSAEPDGLRLYVKAIGTEQPLALSRPGWGAPAWSPDGRFIAFSFFTAENAGIYAVPAFGGPERKLAKIDALQPEIDWSPDGKQLAFAASPAPGARPQVHYLDTATLQQRPVDMPPCTGDCRGDSSPVFSPDGSWLAVLRRFGTGLTIYAVPGAGFSIYAVPVGGGPPRELTVIRGDFGGMDWTPDGMNLIVAKRERWWDEGSEELMRIEIDNGRAQPTGLRGFAPSLARRGHRLAFMQRSRTVNVWRRELTRPDLPPTLLITSSRVQQAARYSPDGSKIVFQSDRSGETEIWMCAGDGSQAIQLTDLKSLSGTPSWSPDGKKIAFDSLTHDGTQQLIVLDLEAGSRVTLHSDRPSSGTPSWSPDGRFIYFADTDFGEMPPPVTQVWRLPSGGGHAVQLTEHGGIRPVQPIGSGFVYFAKRAGTTPLGFAIWRVRADGTEEGPVEGLPPLRTIVDDWTATAAGIYFIDGSEVNPGLKFFDFEGRSTRLLGRLPYPRTPWQPGLSVSPDGRHLLYAQTDVFTSDVMLVQGFH